MCHLGVSQLMLIQFSVWGGWVKFKVSDSQNFGRGKRMCYQFRSEIYVSQEQMGVADFSRMTRPKPEQDIHHWARRECSNVKTLVWLYMNAKSLNYWLCKFVANTSKLGGLYPFRTFFEENKILFAWDVIYFKFIWCRMIFCESADIWILYPNL